jgi:hypothetical protein
MSVRLHWHFVIATKPDKTRELLRLASLIWQERNGNADIREYDASRPGAHYLAKTAVENDFHYLLHGLGRLTYSGPQDILAAIRTDKYVPDHARQMVRGQTLRMRGG